MQINVPAPIRVAIYVIVVLGTAVIVPLHGVQIVSDVFFNVWTSVAGAASALAVINVTSGSNK